MAKTNFKPDQHGFAFVNSFPLNKKEQAQIRQTLTSSTGALEVGGAPNSRPAGLAGLLGNNIFRHIETWIESALPDYYGLCGGMAFTAADYYAAGKPLPRGRDRTDIPLGNSAYQRALRDHLWTRQLQSLGINSPKLLNWMLMLHLPFVGPGWLLERSREEWLKLKGYVDQGRPWPICLVGSTTSPFNNHQVLAIGYDDRGDGTGTIYVYDMNCPGNEQTIKLDMRGSELRAEESCHIDARGALRGFFCEIYKPAALPNLPDAA